MKFAKELERDLVPEWRIKYLNYKSGKKHVKAISRAITRNNATPSVRPRRTELAPREAPSFTNPPSSDDSDVAEPLHASPAPIPHSIPKPIPARSERQSLTKDRGSDMQYGSFIATPPAHSNMETRAPFELPGPAMRVPSNTGEAQQRPGAHRADSAGARSLNRQALQRSRSMAAIGAGSGQQPSGQTPSDMQTPRTRFHRMFSVTGTPLDRRQSRGEYNMQNMKTFDEVREREREFFSFLDSELDKVEKFYKQKEDHAGERLSALREQLHEMRNRRMEEIEENRRRKDHVEARGEDIYDNGTKHEGGSPSFLDPFKAKLFRPGPNSNALQKISTPLFGGQPGNDDGRDYVRRPHEHQVPYRTAKRKLKLAMQEFYRSLELLKSYALLNRTAFRKLNKKYDKAINARPPYRYMNEKVNKAWFVNSDVLDGHIALVEDLYARYFERGNRKIAAGKLRSLSKKRKDESGSAFRNGLLIGTGLVFSIQGIVYGAQLLFDPDPVVRVHTQYLLQIYGGYFLMLYLFTLFCLDCKIWTVNKVNYPFIFEIEARNHLDWRQLAEFPSFFLFLFGIFLWVNFTRYGSDGMYLYYPVILIGITFVILFLPAPILWHKSRRWFLYSHWRLFFAGLYPVEFRDFFLGDMYCSMTYATSNIELFFCLYAHGWDNPSQCNSSNSRLMGFLSALPPIWRFMQCLRRYKDTRNIFPHLINGGKYTASILSAVFLSVYRIDKSHTNLALFATFSTINGFYTSFWDLFMDFSVLQPNSRHRMLRDITAINKRWVYYLIMVLDPILRFSWIFYAIFTHDTQHNSIASFLIAFAEVTRRGLWTLLRVENEHCGNVAQYKASRDVPLPYELEPLMERVSEDSTSLEPAVAKAASAKSTGVDVNGGESASGRTNNVASIAEEGGAADDATSSVRRRRTEPPAGNGKRTITNILANAHKQDFEKKRKPEKAQVDGAGDVATDDEDDVATDEDDDDDDEDGSLLDERLEARRTVMETSKDDSG